LSPPEAKMARFDNNASIGKEKLKKELKKEVTFGEKLNLIKDKNWDKPITLMSDNSKFKEKPVLINLAKNNKPEESSQKPNQKRNRRNLKKGRTKGPFSCPDPDCYYVYGSKFMYLLTTEIQDHMDAHRHPLHLKRNEKGDVFCDECDWTVKPGRNSGFKESYIKHKRTVHGSTKGVLECNQCNYKTERPPNFKRHLNSHKEERTLFGCTMCQKTSTQKNNLVLHMLKKHGQKTNNMNVEYREIKKKNSEIFRSHPLGAPELSVSTQTWSWKSGQFDKLVNEGKLRVEECQGPEDPDLFCCVDCPEEGPMKSLKSLREHRLIKHTDDPYIKCGVCLSLSKETKNPQRGGDEPMTDDDILAKSGRFSDVAPAFKFGESLMDHRLSKHGIDPPKGVRLLTCLQCDRQYRSTSKINMSQHLMKCTEKDCQEIQCHICGKDFANRHYIDEHIMRVHDQQPGQFQCSKCPVSCFNAAALRQHVKLKHSDVPIEARRVYTCEKCGKAFATSDYLKKHVNIVHLNYRPYRCKLCNVSFSNVGNLKEHIGLKHMDGKYHDAKDWRKPENAEVRKNVIYHPAYENLSTNELPFWKKRKRVPNEKELEA